MGIDTEAPIPPELGYDVPKRTLRGLSNEVDRLAGSRPLMDVDPNWTCQQVYRQGETVFLARRIHGHIRQDLFHCENLTVLRTSEDGNIFCAGHELQVLKTEGRLRARYEVAGTYVGRIFTPEYAPVFPEPFASQLHATTGEMVVENTVEERLALFAELRKITNAENHRLAEQAAELGLASRSPELADFDTALILARSLGPEQRVR